MSCCFSSDFTFQGFYLILGKCGCGWNFGWNCWCSFSWCVHSHNSMDIWSGTIRLFYCVYTNFIASWVSWIQAGHYISLGFHVYCAAINADSLVAALTFPLSAMQCQAYFLGDLIHRYHPCESYPGISAAPVRLMDGGGQAKLVCLGQICTGCCIKDGRSGAQSLPSLILQCWHHWWCISHTYTSYWWFSARLQ